VNSVSLGTAFLSGIVSFLSPCVLPLVPGYLSFMSGLTFDQLSSGADRAAVRRRAGLGSVFFVLGFSLVFTLLGASATAAGQFLADHRGVIDKIAGVVIAVFGLHVMGAVKIPWLYYEKRFHSSASPGLAGAFIMGLAFAFGWTPCIGPILAGILALAAQQETVWQGVFLLLAYSAGLGLPFIAAGLATERFLNFFNRYKRFIRWGEIFAGVLLVAIGIMIFTGRLTQLVSSAPEWLYRFSL
jgi:cytochrome c-type biogenesis protein